MKGNKFRFFKLYLSFIGWFIVTIITLGLAALFVNPYYEISKINFYKEILNFEKEDI